MIYNVGKPQDVNWTEVPGRERNRGALFSGSVGLSPFARQCHQKVVARFRPGPRSGHLISQSSPHPTESSVWTEE